MAKRVNDLKKSLMIELLITQKTVHGGVPTILLHQGQNDSGLL